MTYVSGKWFRLISVPLYTRLWQWFCLSAPWHMSLAMISPQCAVMHVSGNDFASVCRDTRLWQWFHLVAPWHTPLPIISTHQCAVTHVSGNDFASVCRDTCFRLAMIWHTSLAMIFDSVCCDGLWQCPGQDNNNTQLFRLQEIPEMDTVKRRGQENKQRKQWKVTRAADAGDGGRVSPKSFSEGDVLPKIPWRKKIGEKNRTGRKNQQK